jgi:AraC family transcriptional regulator, transcriptional activator of pobA
LPTIIKRFAEINEFFETTGFDKRTNISDFFVFSFDELPIKSASSMPPYQKDFFQVSLIINSESSALSIDSQASQGQNNILYFLSPDHIFSWKRDQVTEGFICYFKTSFLGFFNGNIANDFSFFDLSNKNILNINDLESIGLKNDFEKLYQEYYTQNTYRVQILQSMLLSLLFKCKSLSENYSKEEQKHSKKQELLLRFKNLINNRFIADKQVNVYADMLNVTANYLNDCVKEQTGRTAKDLITDKIIIEAKKSLQYGSEDIAQIAFSLGFDEPTNFIRFFKTQTGSTPKAFREQTQQTHNV